MVKEYARFKDLAVIAAGGAGGIGKVIAQGFAQEGGKIKVMIRLHPTAEETLKRAMPASGVWW